MRPKHHVAGESCKVRGNVDEQRGGFSSTWSSPAPNLGPEAVRRNWRDLDHKFGQNGGRAQQKLLCAEPNLGRFDHFGRSRGGVDLIPGALKTRMNYMVVQSKRRRGGELKVFGNDEVHVGDPSR